MEKSTLAKGSSNYNPRNLKHHIFNRSDFEYEYHNEGQIVRENLFGESDEDDSYNEAVRGSSPTAAKYNQPEMYQSEEYSRSSDTVKPSYMFHVNTRIWRNHLRLNYALRVFLILSIVVISLFTSFLKLRYVDYKAGHTYKYNFGPIFFSLDGSWHFVAEIYYCQPHIFPGEFCESGDYKFVSIAAGVYNFGTFLVFLVYIASLVLPRRNIDRLNWLGLTSIFLTFTCIVLIGNIFESLSFGFYSMIVIIIVAAFTQSHFLYSTRKQRRNSLTNQLLEA